MHNPATPERRGWGLGLLALLPLILAGLWMLFADPRWHGWLLEAMALYLALALAFAGGVQWHGLVEASGARFWPHVGLAAGPAVFAWLVLLLPIVSEAALLLLAAGFIALYVVRRALLAGYRQRVG
ncbi:DUF3429 family protein [Ectothiorhodospiraceae bacterium 2226]|nr:DUF3429 family protein [Ectothiorhodospiraceae bacterium 2226]